MAQVYNNFKVLGTDAFLGQVTCVWFDDTRDAQNKRVTPLGQQEIYVNSHRVPDESVGNNWSREDFRLWWINEVPQPNDVPVWAEAEVGKFVITNTEKLRAVDLGD